MLRLISTEVRRIPWAYPGGASAAALLFGFLPGRISRIRPW